MKYAVVCREHGTVPLTEAQYHEQMGIPSAIWKCPVCDQSASWDDRTYEFYLQDRAEGLRYAPVQPGELLRLYILDAEGMHTGGVWFTSTLPLKYPEETLPKPEAQHRETEAREAGNEIRITNGMDILVYHVRAKKVLYPQGTTPEQFWAQV